MQPLTIEQLKSMGGNPVWLKRKSNGTVFCNMVSKNGKYLIYECVEELEYFPIEFAIKTNDFYPQPPTE